MVEKQLKGIFFLTLSLFWGLLGVSNYFEGSLFSPTKKSETSVRIQQIDQEIEQLEDMKRGFEGRALRHEDLAERLQFDDHAVLETRRHLQIAAENRAKAAKVQQEIDHLRAEKRTLLKQ